MKYRQYSCSLNARLSCTVTGRGLSKRTVIDRSPLLKRTPLASPVRKCGSAGVVAGRGADLPEPAASKSCASPPTKSLTGTATVIRIPSAGATASGVASIRTRTPSFSVVTTCL